MSATVWLGIKSFETLADFVIAYERACPPLSIEGIEKAKEAKKKIININAVEGDLMKMVYE